MNEDRGPGLLLLAAGLCVFLLAMLISGVVHLCFAFFCWIRRGGWPERWWWANVGWSMVGVGEWAPSRTILSWCWVAALVGAFPLAAVLLALR